MSTTRYTPSSDEAVPTENTTEMEARMRQRVVESCRKKKSLGENVPVAKSHLASNCVGSSNPQAIDPATRHTPFPRDTRSFLEAKQSQLADEITQIKADLERAVAKPKSTSTSRTRMPWPKPNLDQPMIIDLSDDEADENGPANLVAMGRTRTASQLQVITNRS